MSITLRFEDGERVVFRDAAESLLCDTSESNEEALERTSVQPRQPLPVCATLPGVRHPDLLFDFLRDQRLPGQLDRSQLEALRKNVPAIPNRDFAQSLEIELDHVYVHQEAVRTKHGTDKLYAHMLALGDVIWLQQFDQYRAMQIWLQAYAEAVRGMKRRHFFPNSDREFEVIDWRPPYELDGERVYRLSGGDADEYVGATASLMMMHQACLHALYAAVVISGPPFDDKTCVRFLVEAGRCMRKSMAFDADVCRAFMMLMKVQLDDTAQNSREFAITFYERVQTINFDSQSIAQSSQPYEQSTPPSPREPQTGFWLDRLSSSSPLVSLSARGVRFDIPSDALDRLGEDGKRLRILLRTDSTWRDSGVAMSGSEDDDVPLLDCDPELFALVHQFIITGQVPADGVTSSILGQLESLAEYLCCDLLRHEVTFFHPLRLVMAGLRASRAGTCIFDSGIARPGTPRRRYVFEQLCLGNALFARLGDRRGARWAWLDAWRTRNASDVDFSLMELVWRHGFDNSIFDRGLTLTECTLAQCQRSTIALLQKGCKSKELGQLTHLAMQLDASNVVARQLRMLYLAATSAGNGGEEACKVNISPLQSTVHHCYERCEGWEMKSDVAAERQGSRCKIVITDGCVRTDDVVSLMAVAWYSQRSGWQECVGLAASSLLVLITIAPWASEVHRLLGDLLGRIKTNMFSDIDSEDDVWRIEPVDDETVATIFDTAGLRNVTRSDCIDALFSALLLHPSSSPAAQHVMTELQRAQDWKRSEQLLLALRDVADTHGRPAAAAAASARIDVNFGMATMLLQKYIAVRRDGSDHGQLQTIMDQAVHYGGRAMRRIYAEHPPRSAFECAQCAFLMACCYDEEGNYDTAHYYGDYAGIGFELQHYERTTDDDRLAEMQAMLLRVCAIACRANAASTAVTWLSATIRDGTWSRDTIAIRLALFQCQWHAGDVQAAKRGLDTMIDQDMPRLVSTPYLQQAYALDVDLCLAMDDEASVRNAMRIYDRLLDEEHRTESRRAQLYAAMLAMT